MWLIEVVADSNLYWYSVLSCTAGTTSNKKLQMQVLSASFRYPIPLRRDQPGVSVPRGVGLGVKRPSSSVPPTRNLFADPSVDTLDVEGSVAEVRVDPAL